MPGMFARKSTWDRLNPAERYLAVVRTLSDIHPTWIFCSYSAACLYGLEVSLEAFEPYPCMRKLSAFLKTKTVH